MTDFNFSKNWRYVKLGDLSLSINSGFPSGNHNTEKNGVPHLRPMNITYFGNIDLNQTKYVEKNKNQFNLNKGDILFNNTNSLELLGKTALIKNDANWAFSNHMTRIRVNQEKCHSSYIAFFLHFLFWQGFFRINAVNHVNQASIGKSFLSEKIIIPLPPLPEQHRIVAKIEELFSELDKGIENLKKAKEQIKVYRQSVLKWAFEGKLRNSHQLSLNLRNSPSNWKIVELKEVCLIKRGKSKHRPRNEPSLFGGKYPFIQTGDVRNANGGYINKFNQTYSEKGLNQSRLWPKGTLCITIAANIGETAILGLDACFPDSVVGLVCNEKLLLNKYTNYYFISYKSKLEKLAPATAQKNINVEILEKIKIPLPSMEEQNQIVSEIERRFSVADKLEETIDKGLQQSEMLRQGILKKAFEGRLV